MDVSFKNADLAVESEKSMQKFHLSKGFFKKMTL